MGLTNPLTLTLYLVTLWAVVFPITTLLHECGHVLTALVLTDQDVTIVLVGWGRGLRGQWGRLRVVVGWLSGFFGFVRFDRERVPTRQLLWITLAGPVVSLLLTVLFWSLVSTWSELRWFEFVMRTFTYATFCQFLSTILPLRYPRWLGAYGGRTSDGWRVLRLLREQRHVT